MKHLTRLTILLLSVLLMVACGGDKNKKPDPEPETQVVQKVEEEPVQEAQQEVQITESESTRDPLLDETKIYFDFDKADIKSEFRDIIAAHANYLSANPDATVTIEGHCDERGTREYNMALGERRAHSVSKLLTLQGVRSSQINTVSKGEEQPEVEGHDESAWKWNRRAILVY